MRLKTFSIFGLSFLVMFTLTSCDNENLVNEEELNFSDENPTLIVLAEQKAGNDGYDEKGFSIVNCPNSLELHKLYSGLKLNFQLSGVTRIELESVDGYALSGTVGIQWDETGQPVIGEAENASATQKQQAESALESLLQKYTPDEIAQEKRGAGGLLDLGALGLVHGVPPGPDVTRPGRTGACWTASHCG